MPNQDPVTLLGLTPLLGIFLATVCISLTFIVFVIIGIDIWEHAFYLQYKNVKVDYVKAIWDVVNWKDVEARYNEATK